MLIKQYEDRGLFFNANLTERCSKEALDVYRGELILVDGEVGDSSGRRKPPSKVLLQSVAIAGESKLVFLAGMIENVSDLSLVLERFGPDMAADSQCVIFVYDIAKPLTVSAGELTVQLVPLDDGLVWTELMDLAALEKGDVKNLSSADKAHVVYRELLSFRPRGAASVDLAAALTMGSGKQRALRGAV